MSQDSNVSQTNKSAEAEKTTPDKRTIPSSYIWAVAFAGLIFVWMISGQFKSEDNPDDQSGTSNAAVASASEKTQSKKQSQNKATSAPEKAQKLFHVKTQLFKAEKRRTNLTVRGRTEVEARVEIKAETTGVIERVSSKKGTWVKKGDLLCKIETAEREAALLQAKANLAKAEADYTANIALAKRGHAAQLKVATVRAQLDAAKAELKRAELNLDRTTIEAPFDGFVEAQPAKVGDFLSIGDSCATLVVLDPLVVVGFVSELEIVALKVGMDAQIRVISGDIKEGKIRFVSSSADTATRTFRIEVEIDNKKASLRDGLTADINIPLQFTKAHRFSPAILVLDADGKIGVRTVDENNTVKFVPVKLLSDSSEGVWVAGLPETVKVIIVGQEYVIDGQQVRVTETTQQVSAVKK